MLVTTGCIPWAQRMSVEVAYRISNNVQALRPATEVKGLKEGMLMSKGYSLPG